MKEALSQKRHPKQLRLSEPISFNKDLEWSNFCLELHSVQKYHDMCNNLVYKVQCKKSPHFPYNFEGCSGWGEGGIYLEIKVRKCIFKKDKILPMH